MDASVLSVLRLRSESKDGFVNREIVEIDIVKYTLRPTKTSDGASHGHKKVASCLPATYYFVLAILS